MREWVTSTDRPQRDVGDRLVYEVRRGGSTSAVALDLEVSVRLTDYPLRAALAANTGVLLLCGLGLVVASLVFWRAPTATPARAWLLAAALVPTVLTSSPLGLGAVDLAGGRGVWPHLAGELVAAVGVVAAVAVAITLTAPPTRPRWGWAALAAPADRLRRLGAARRRARRPGRAAAGVAHHRGPGRAGSCRRRGRRAAGGVRRAARSAPTASPPGWSCSPWPAGSRSGCCSATCPSGWPGGRWCRCRCSRPSSPSP